MAPLQPPLPTASNFPFQPDAGIQTSILMLESWLGARVAATRQKAGRLRMGWGAPGGVKSPAATDWAEVILVSGSDSEARLSQEAAAAADGRSAAKADTARREWK